MKERGIEKRVSEEKDEGTGSGKSKREKERKGKTTTTIPLLPVVPPSSVCDVCVRRSNALLNN